MDGAGHESFEFDMIGAGWVRSGDGREVAICARLSWMMIDEVTTRYMIFLEGDPKPLVCFNGEALPVIGKKGATAFRHLLERNRQRLDPVR